MIRQTGHPRCRFLLTAASWILAWMWMGSVIVSAAETTGDVEEQTGPIAPSIHVPPVRLKPPSRTHFIKRPPQYDSEVSARKQRLSYRMESLRLAVEDLMATFGPEYPNGADYLRRWDQIAVEMDSESPSKWLQFRRLRDEALRANPLLDFERMLVLKRKTGQLGLPTNHQCNTCLEQNGFDNEVAILAPVHPRGQLTTLFRPSDDAYVGELDLHFDADRLLLTMPNGRTWQIHEIRLRDREIRQVSREVAGVDNFDACYLPDGGIVFASTASFTGVPCWHGRERACCLYRMDADGSNIRQLCYDQDLDLHPAVLANGQVIYSRWDYTGIQHAYVRPLMVMNPDGTGQRAVCGSNTYYPNCLFFPRAVPGDPNKIVAILAGYHGKNRMGELAVLDVSRGWDGESGIVHRMTHRDEPIVPVVLDMLTNQASPQFLHPYPLSEKYVLTAMQPTPRQPWGIYLVDAFDNVTPILTDEEYDFFEPIPIRRHPAPPVIPDSIDPSREDAIVFLHDIYQGPGLRGVPRGTITHLRIAAYHFGYPGMAGPDKIGRAGPWEVMRILGTVPVYEDGSAKFRVPACTPITLQALDQEGQAVQLMRSWYTAMPGELTSCVGCHETPNQTPVVRGDLAAQFPASEIEPWYGPPRGFDFAREVQPVLDEYCVACHDGQQRIGTESLPDLRAADRQDGYVGLPLTALGADRLDPSTLASVSDRFSACVGMPKPYGNHRTRYTPAYESLIPFIRRVNIEDSANLLRPGEYHADTSPLIQMLKKGHYRVELSREAWDRLITWIDLNGPCHGQWSAIAPIPDEADRQRLSLARAYGGPTFDPEVNPIDSPQERSVRPAIPLEEVAERRERHRQAALQLQQTVEAETDIASEGSKDTMTLDLGGGVEIELVHVPRGRFVMGDLNAVGAEDEHPASVVEIERAFWIGKCEVTNEQLRRLCPEHTSGFFTKRQIDVNGPGIQLDEPQQPAVRVSWNEAMLFCRRLSQISGYHVTLPTEAQWEYAARAGTTTELSYGDADIDFSPHANMADRSLACIYVGTAGVAVLQPIPADMRYDDQAIGTADVGSYSANPWGLYDMHGNAAEWTRSVYRPYPYRADDGKNDVDSDSPPRVVRGGSFYERPQRCRSAHRFAYHPWYAVHDVGFRIIIEEPN